MATRTNIIMAAFNNSALTRRTIVSVLKNSVSDFKFIIVNNGSTDDTDEVIKSFLPNERIDYVQAEKNEGCGIGRNIGLRRRDADCKYVFLLDNDIYVPQAWDQKMIDFMDKYPQIGLAGPATNFAGTPQMKKNLPPLETDEQIEEYALSHPIVPEYSNVQFKWPVIGFCQIVRREVYDQIGIFDENFKLYGCEDNDFCYRAQCAGWKLVYLDSVFIYHHGHGGLSLLGEEGTTQWHENREYFKRKNGFL